MLCAHLYNVTSRSGTEEQYTALQQLLEDISQYMKDFAAARELQKGVSKKKVDEDKKKGEEMRKAVMEGQASIYIYFLLMVCPKIALPFCVHFKGVSCSKNSSLLSSPTLSVDKEDDVEELDEAEIIESNKKKRKIAMVC